MRVISKEDVDYLANHERADIQYVVDDSCLVANHKPYPYKTKKKRHIRKWRARPGNTWHAPALFVGTRGYYGQIAEVRGKRELLWELDRIVEARRGEILDAVFDDDDCSLPRLRNGRWG